MFATDAERVSELKARLQTWSKNYAKPEPYVNKKKRVRTQYGPSVLYIENDDDWQHIANRIDAYPRHVVVTAYNSCVHEAENNPKTTWRELEFYHLLWHR